MARPGRGALDAGRASQCARVSRKLVVPGHLPETDYDNVAVDWLEKTSKIIDLCGKAGKDMTCDEMLDVINVLKVRQDTGAKKLRLLKNKVEGKETVATDGKGPELNAQLCLAHTTISNMKPESLLCSTNLRASDQVSAGKQPSDNRGCAPSTAALWSRSQ